MIKAWFSIWKEILNIQKVSELVVLESFKTVRCTSMQSSIWIRNLIGLNRIPRRVWKTTTLLLTFVKNRRPEKIKNSHKKLIPHFLKTKSPNENLMKLKVLYIKLKPFYWGIRLRYGIFAILYRKRTICIKLDYILLHNFKKWTKKWKFSKIWDSKQKCQNGNLLVLIMGTS